MLRRDFLKTATATTVLTATLPVHAKETPAKSNANFADVNGQHVFYSVRGAGKPLILLHGEEGRLLSGGGGGLQSAGGQRRHARR